MNKGFTLIEVVIYIALFSLLMTGGIIGVYQIIETSGRADVRSESIEDAAFVIRKIEWALGQATLIVISPNPGPNATVIIVGETLKFSLVDGAVMLNGTPLTTRLNIISSLVFSKTPGTGSVRDALEMSLTISDSKGVEQTFKKTWYLFP